MKRIIKPSYCIDTFDSSDESKYLDSKRSSFILKKKLRGLAGNRKLGVLWLALDPILTSLVYLFVFTVIRSNPNAEIMFIGITLFRIFNASLKSGINSVKDFSGGIKSERVRTRALMNATIQFRLIDSFLQSFGVGIILLVIFEIDTLGVIIFLIISQILGIISEGFGMNISLLVRKIPDLSNLINNFLLLMFFGSPALYSMNNTEGLHRKINEYNPFTYFVEYARHFAGLDTAKDYLNNNILIILMILITILSIRGFYSMDKLRWEVSAWS
jgi:ABC-type polysaccharide/polyol phosphate export permease